MAKEIKIRIKIKGDRFGFAVEKNFKETPSDLLMMAGILDIIKKSQIAKIGEIKKRGLEQDG